MPTIALGALPIPPRRKASHALRGLLLVSTLALTVAVSGRASAQETAVRDEDGTLHHEFGDEPSRIYSEYVPPEIDDKELIPRRWLDDGYKPPQVLQEEGGANFCSELVEGLRADLRRGRVVFSGIATCTPETTFFSVAEFTVQRAWWGPFQPGDRASVSIKIDGGCGHEPVLAGQPYLLVIPCETTQPSRQDLSGCRASYPRPLAHATKYTEFLDSKERPVRHDEIKVALRSWRSGRWSAGETHAWFESANALRDLANWQDPNALIDHEILTALEGLISMGISEAAARNCALRRDIAEEVFQLISTHEGNPASFGEAWREYWQKLWHTLREGNPCEPRGKWLDNRREHAEKRAGEAERPGAESARTEIAIRIQGEPALDSLAPNSTPDSSGFAHVKLHVTVALLNPPTFDLEMLMSGIRFECTAVHEKPDTFVPHLDTSCWLEEPLPWIRPNIIRIRFVIEALDPGEHAFRASWQDPRSGFRATSEERTLSARTTDESPAIHRAFLVSQARRVLKSESIDGYSAARAMYLEAAAGNSNPWILEELADASTPWASPDETASYYHRWLDASHRSLLVEFGAPEHWPKEVVDLDTKRSHKVTAFDYLLPHYRENATALRVDLVDINGQPSFVAKWRSHGGIWRIIILK